MPTSSSSRVIEVRKAKGDDYQAVIDINKNVYMGTDYLPFQYHDLISDPDFAYYVCLVDAEVAAFEGLCLLDDNKTFMMRSLRVKDKFKGQGLLSHMRKKIYEDYKDMPGEKRLRSACSDEARYVHSKTFRSQNKTLLMQKLVRFDEVDASKIRPVSGNDQEAKPISWEDFGHLMQIEALKNFLYPEDLITVDFWFYDAIPSNIRHMKKRSPVVFITKDLYKFLPMDQQSWQTTSECAEELKGNNCENNNITQGLVGIVSSYFSPSFLYFVVTLSGKPAEGREREDITSIMEHSLAFMKTLYKDDSKKQKAVFAFVCSTQFPDGLFHDAAESFGLQPTTWLPNYKEQYYFEQDFEKLRDSY